MTLMWRHYKDKTLYIDFTNIVLYHTLISGYAYMYAR